MNRGNTEKGEICAICGGTVDNTVALAQFNAGEDVVFCYSCAKKEVAQYRESLEETAILLVDSLRIMDTIVKAKTKER